MADENLKLAKKIKKAVDAQPDLTADEIAEQVGVERSEVEAILTSYVVDANGALSYAGDGRGGGWVKPPEPEAEPVE